MWLAIRGGVVCHMTLLTHQLPGNRSVDSPLRHPRVVPASTAVVHASFHDACLFPFVTVLLVSLLPQSLRFIQLAGYIYILSVWICLARAAPLSSSLSLFSSSHLWRLVRHNYIKTRTVFRRVSYDRDRARHHYRDEFSLIFPRDVVVCSGAFPVSAWVPRGKNTPKHRFFSSYPVKLPHHHHLPPLLPSTIPSPLEA